MSKAWKCCDEDNNYVEVLFADSRGKAKTYFKNMDTFAWFDFLRTKAT